MTGTPNIYVYVRGNPVSLTDPLGLRPLTDCEKNALRDYIDDVDLNNADLHDNEVPWWLRDQYGGVTLGNDIYFRPGVYDPGTTEGIALLGHELTHVGQFRNGMTLLDYIWSTRHDYAKSKYEKEAYSKQRQIQNDLSSYGGNGQCSCTGQ